MQAPKANLTIMSTLLWASWGKEMNLLEGLKEGDLENLVLPLVSIDEYESKLDDDSIVIGFFVGDKEPASDLNRFIQKGAVDILDTDVSPAPNEEGHFMVFVEVLRDKEFPQKLLDIVDSLTGLTENDSWNCVVYGDEAPQPLTLEYLETNVRLLSVEDALQESITDFFRESVLDGLDWSDGNLTFERRGLSKTYKLVDFDTFENLSENNAVMSLPVRLDEESQGVRRLLETLLGDHWLVEHLGGYVVLSRYNEPKMALLRI